jgi:NAD-dependent DNA ligase
MEELKTFLIKAKDEYYKGNPIIPDEVYDRLEEQVGILEVGSSEDARIPHMFPMYSLQKIYEGEKDPHKVYKQWAEGSNT